MAAPQCFLLWQQSYFFEAMSARWQIICGDIFLSLSLCRNDKLFDKRWRLYLVRTWTSVTTYLWSFSLSTKSDLVNSRWGPSECSLNLGSVAHPWLNRPSFYVGTGLTKLRIDRMALWSTFTVSTTSVTYACLLELFLALSDSYVNCGQSYKTLYDLNLRL